MAKGDSNLPKSSVLTFRRKQMPNPDRDVNYMKEMWGTTKLVTDYFIEKTTNQPPSDRYSRPCGGKGGFDDYVERWHE
jgi:hypothetical protein